MSKQIAILDLDLSQCGLLSELHKSNIRGDIVDFHSRTGLDFGIFDRVRKICVLKFCSTSC